jgi:hypothetical protein
MGEYKQYKQELWRDKRAEIKVDPNIELEDYTGPVRTDLRFTDFSRKQLGNMYSLAHHYNYAILRAYREFIHDTWGPEDLYEAQEAVWGTTMVSDVYQWVTETMKNNGKDLEAFMKHWQIDMNTQPGDHFDVIFEMPSKDRGIVTYNRCPVVEEYEASGKTDRLPGVCKKTCAIGLKNMAALYNEDIDIKVLAMPPRKSKDHICCKFEVCYKSKAAKSRQEAKEVDLKIDRKKKDIRGELKVNPNVELQDYSGPFKPDLRITDFSREQLARMYLMCHKYDLAMMIAYQGWAIGKHGFDVMADMAVDVWGRRLFGAARQINMRFLKIKEQSIDTFMKCWQCDITALPPNFYQTFEKPSKDVGIVTFHTCYAVTTMEPMGMNEQLLKLCAMDPLAIGKSTKLYHPDMRVKILAFPPRKSQDDVCCKWELYYESNKKSKGSK